MTEPASPSVVTLVVTNSLIRADTRKHCPDDHKLLSWMNRYQRPPEITSWTVTLGV